MHNLVIQEIPVLSSRGVADNARMPVVRWSLENGAHESGKCFRAQRERNVLDWRVSHVLQGSAQAMYGDDQREPRIHLCISAPAGRSWWGLLKFLQLQNGDHNKKQA